MIISTQEQTIVEQILQFLLNSINNVPGSVDRNTPARIYLALDLPFSVAKERSYHSKIYYINDWIRLICIARSWLIIYNIFLM